MENDFRLAVNISSSAPDPDYSSDDRDARVIGMFLSTKKRRSEKTAEVYHGVIQEFFRFLKYKPMNSISYEDLVVYSEFLAQPDPMRRPVLLAVNTQNRKISTIKSLFKYAMRIGYLPFNPAEPLETQRVNTRIAQRLVDGNELERLLSAAGRRGTLHQLVIFFFACTGCRVSELAGLNWKDFYFAAGGQVGVNIHGKGHKERQLKINDSLWNLIVRYRTEKLLNTEIDSQDRSPLLINRFGNAYHPQSLWKAVKQSCDDAGIRKNISPHWLRHTFATEVSKDGNANIWQLQQDLGHASLYTTQAYVHVARGLDDTSVDHLGYLDRLEKNLEK